MMGEVASPASLRRRGLGVALIGAFLYPVDGTGITIAFAVLGLIIFASGTRLAVPVERGYEEV